MFRLLCRIPAYYLFRLTGWALKLPINLTLSISFKCNSRCKTCNIYTKNCDELSLEEWRRIFENIGKNLFWVTISGGEPFLRSDIFEIVQFLYDKCKPRIINIPTNGLLTQRIRENAERIALYCKNAQIVINVSIDDIGKRHDEIRGVPGSFEKALKSIQALQLIDLPNLSIGIHTVISKFNVARVPQIYKELRALNPDSYITEIAEEREELNTIDSGITPEYQDYADAVDFLIKEMKTDHFSGIGRITRAFRIEYYRMVKKILKYKRQIIPCYSGVSSAQVAPNGDVWMCCIKAEPIGNLRASNYDFRKVWISEKARKLRHTIKNGDCYCPLANTSYTSMLQDFKTLCRVAWNFVELK